ncbi:MAG TPA: GntR family transcriptional regulator [Vicinamibacterales bacterium]|jgi:GntR family transcriptional regulator|nr:GntR family transcriptional regulator [Vicinamibacterales bacterium]
MLPFTVTLRPGEPVYEQVVYAVRRAVVTGQLRAGDPFPSVREMSQALKINPNTAARIVALLVEDKLLTVRPGIGTVVGDGSRGDATARREVLEHETERLVVEARGHGVSLADLIGAIKRHWARTITRER